jgi:hypothetical protein
MILKSATRIVIDPKMRRIVQAWTRLVFMLLFVNGMARLPAAFAAEVEVGDSPADLSIQLQVAARQHYEHHKINGYWHFVDHSQQRPSKLKPDFSSPQFYRFGDYYAVRYLFIDLQGMPRPMIFYMTRRRANEFVIVHMDVGDDKPLESLVRNKVAQPVKFDFGRRNP